MNQAEFSVASSSQQHPRKAPLTPAPVTELHRHGHISFVASLSFQSGQAAGTIQTSAQHSVPNAASFLGTGMTPGSRQAPAEGLRELWDQPRSRCSRSWRRHRAPSAGVSLRLPRISGSSEAASRGCDRQRRPIPAATQPADLQGLGAALMSFRPRGGCSARTPRRRLVRR